MESKNLSYYEDKKLSGDLASDIGLLSDIFRKDATFRLRKANIGGTSLKCALFFIDGMADGETIAESILRSLVTAKVGEDFYPSPDNIAEILLYSSEAQKTDNLAVMLRGITYGDTLLIIEGQKSALVINTKGFRVRSVDEPPNERVAVGPREGFCEAALLNVALVRRKLQTPDFCAELVTCGKRTDTMLFICYLDSLADSKTVDEVKKRIKKINIDGILDSNYIAEKIRDRKRSIFKTVGTTERPDVAAAKLLEGRIAVICDGTPAVLTVPYLLIENFQSDDDYYLGFTVGSIGRIFRILSFIFGSYFTGIYVALVTFHAGLLPTYFALAVLRLRIGVPTSTLTESLALITAFEILKEACARAPRDSGTALGIVGGLVIGEAAVNTSMVSAPTLIIVALAGICSVMIPRMRGAVFFINLFSVIAGGLFGLFGLFSVFVVSTVYMLKLTSFGTDQTEELLHPDLKTFKDTFIRVPWGNMINRPLFSKNSVRQKK